MNELDASWERLVKAKRLNDGSLGNCEYIPLVLSNETGTGIQVENTWGDWLGDNFKDGEE